MTRDHKYIMILIISTSEEGQFLDDATCLSIVAKERKNNLIKKKIHSQVSISDLVLDLWSRARSRRRVML